MTSDLHPSIDRCIRRVLCFTRKIWFNWLGRSRGAVNTILSLRTVHWVGNFDNLEIWTYRIVFKANHQVFGVYGFLKWTWVTNTRHTRPESKTHHSVVMYVLDDRRFNSDDDGTTGNNHPTRGQHECKWREGYVGSAHDRRSVRNGRGKRRERW